MGEKVASLYAEIGLESKKLDQGLTQAKGALAKAGASLKDLTNQIPGLNSALALATNPITLVGAGIAAAGKFAADATRETIAYNKQIREMSTALGLSSDETSRIVQVGDDWGISIDAIRQSLGLMAKNGLQPSIENLANLADEFVNTTDKTAFAEKASKLLGRQWQTLIPILKDGGDSLRAQAAAIDDSLIATDASIKASRQYEVAMDNLGDAVSGVKYQIGNALIPVLTDAANWINNNVNMNKLLKKEFDSLTISYGQGAIIANKYALGLITEKQALEELAKAKANNADKTDIMTDAEHKAAAMAEKFGVEINKAGGEVEKASQQVTGYNGYLAENTGAAGEAAAANSKVALAIGEVTKAALGKEALDALTAAYQAGTISEKAYEQAAIKVMSSMIGMPVTMINAQIELRRMKEDLEEGKISAYGFVGGLNDLSSMLDRLNGKIANAYVNVFTNMTTTPNIQGGQITPGTPARTAPRVQGGQFVERAAGGPVMPYGDYLVGEAGPELLSMRGGRGWVTPNVAGDQRPINIVINGNVTRDNAYFLARQVGNELQRQARYN